MLKMAKILVPIDFSERSADVARAVVPVADRFGSEINLVHVLSSRFGPHLIASPETSLRDFEAQTRAEAKKSLEGFFSTEWRNLAVKRTLLEGDPATEIVAYAESEHVDLIMMPTQGYGPFRRLLLGSVTAKVLHDAPCPVWTTVHLATTLSQAGGGKPHKMACAVDLGKRSNDIVTAAIRLSKEFGASLTLIHVISSLDNRDQTYYLSPEWRSEVIGAARSELAKLQESLGFEGGMCIETGAVADAVAAAAKKIEAGLLIIGRTHRDSLTGRLPNNAYAIIRESPCPVLSI
jgi:nucleotide-binding universal stress UspA family protein